MPQMFVALTDHCLLTFWLALNDFRNILCPVARWRGAWSEDFPWYLRLFDRRHCRSAFCSPNFEAPQHLQRYIHSSFDIVEIAIRIQQ